MSLTYDAVQFKAGKLVLDGRTLKPDPRKGLLRVLQVRGGGHNGPWATPGGVCAPASAVAGEAAGAGCMFAHGCRWGLDHAGSRPKTIPNVIAHA